MKQKHVQEIRSFNRFYTSVIGLLDKHILNSKYSLIEGRILHELYVGKSLTASDIIILIDIDKGYLSRTLKKFESSKLVSKVGSEKDKRAATIQLSEKGKKEYEILNTASDNQAGALFKNLSERECDELINKISEIQILIKKGLNHD